MADVQLYLSHMTLQDLRKDINELPNEIEVDSSAKVYLADLERLFIEKVTVFAHGSEGKKEFNHFEGLRDRTSFGIRGFIDDLTKRISNFNEKCKKCLQPDSKTQDFDDFVSCFFNGSGKCIDEKVMTESLPIGTDFYRVRGTDKSNPYHLFDLKGMYMMDSDLSSKVGTARFNLSGYPCLYLAESLYLAWEECRRPDFHTANFTRFRNRRYLTVLNLTIPESRKLNSEAAFFRSYLSLVCSAKAKDDDKDHWQYRISNLFIKMVYQLEGRKIDGIKYMSSKRFENKNFRIEYGKDSAAYVFPPKNLDDKHCEKLAALFEMTEAFSYFYFKIHSLNFVSPKKAVTREYDDTIFAFLENQLKNEKVTQCIDIIKTDKTTP